MPVPSLALSSANVVSSGPSAVNFRLVQIAVVDGRAVVTEQTGYPLGERTDVASIEPDQASGGWLVRFDNGDIWTVVRARGGCGCR